MCEKGAEIIVLPGKIVRFEVEDGESVFVYIKDVIRDFTTRNRVGWIVTMAVLSPTKGMEPVEAELKVNNEHIRGEAFTISGSPRQFHAVDLECPKQTKKAAVLKLVEK